MPTGLNWSKLTSAGANRGALFGHESS